MLLALGGAGTDAAIGMIVIQLLANGILQQMVQPIAYGAALGIHPLAVLIVTIAGGALFGAVGLILAAPLTVGRNAHRRRSRPGPRRADPGMTVTSSEEPRTGLGLPIAILASAQFVMVLDSSVMNVSISQIVADLDTTIQGVQLAITAYTLVMAAFMLARRQARRHLGPRPHVRDRPRRSTAWARSRPRSARTWRVLLIGWSLIEGIGAALVIPAIVVADRRRPTSGKQRALAFGIVGGVAGAAIAAGPLIGGWVTTEFSWRYVFAARDRDRRGDPAAAPAARTSARARAPLPRSTWSASRSRRLGLGLAVFGILKSSEWGLIEPRGAPDHRRRRRSRRSASRPCRS